jgi:hypothetical protein
MLDLALEDLQRAASLGRELLSRHPELAQAALDLLLFNVGCWEVRWLNVATDPDKPGAMPLADVEGMSSLDFEHAKSMSARARELVDPSEAAEPHRRAEQSHDLPGDMGSQVGHGQAPV